MEFHAVIHFLEAFFSLEDDFAFILFHTLISRYKAILSMGTIIRECQTGLPSHLLDTAHAEQMTPERLASRISAGTVVVPQNILRTDTSHVFPPAIGEGCRVKVNVNVGTSASRCDPDLEYKKACAAIENGTDAIMDLSTAGDLKAIRASIRSLDSTLGTVPIYEAVRRAGNIADLDADLLFSVIREHCKEGVDFVTLHCGINLEVLKSLRSDPRTMGVVSRGGVFHTAHMITSGLENPLWSEFEYLLEILAEYEVTLSLGDGMRPGCHDDATRHAKTVEYLNLGRLAARSLKAGVQRMIEGPGHIPLDQIGYNVSMMKELSRNTPLYLLGPLVTDIGAGYDHVVGAIGGVMACAHGADFLCMVSPSEHLALPDVSDIIEGTRVCILAAHIGNLSRNLTTAKSREIEMGVARSTLDWERQFSCTLFPEVARSIHSRDDAGDTCSMCGDLCAIKMLKEVL
jgi:phosphomethylpyrimidine synthase